jgi:hypothetical protein
VVVTLLAGRAAFRGAIVLSAPLLLVAWGTGTFAPYALAMGGTLVLNPLVGSGTEKSAGTVLPRYPRRPAADRLLTAHLLTAATITGGCLLLATVFAAVDPHRAGLWLLAGTTNVGFGAVQALVAYWRVLGLPMADPASFGVLAAVTAGGLVLVVFAGAGPMAYLALQAASAGTVSAALVLGLRRRLRRPRGRTVRLVTRTTLLMGANTLLATAPFSVVIAVLGGQSDPGPVSHVYVAVTAYSIVGNVLDYLQRIYQPWLTTALRADPDRIRRPFRRVARLGRNVLAPAGALAVGAAGWVLDPPAATLVGMAAVAPTLVAVALSVWVLENAATSRLLVTTRAGAVGLVSTVATAVLLVRPLGATGALLALLVGAAVQQALLPDLSSRRTVPPTGGDARVARHAEPSDVR